MCRCHTVEEIRDFDVTEDKKVQAFLGSPSTYETVHMLPKSYLESLPVIKEEDLNVLFEGMEDILCREHIEKIREMIWKRWCSLGSI